MLHWINNLVILKMNTISSLSGVWRCSGWQRAGCRTETGDLGDWCQCGNLQGEVSGVNAVCLTTLTHSWLAKSWSSMTKWSLIENLCSFFCSVSFSNSQTPTPERMRTLVWTWMSRFICRNWMRWEVQYWLERQTMIAHVWSCRSLNIQFLCNNISALCVCVSDQCCWRAGTECELQSYSDVWCWSLPSADLLSTGESDEPSNKKINIKKFLPIKIGSSYFCF